jgi:phosphoglycerate dehydrogenase-like enzyme
MVAILGAGREADGFDAMKDQWVIVVQGAAGSDELPGIAGVAAEASLRFAPGVDALRELLPEADVLFGWDFQAESLSATWSEAKQLRWVHWSGAGVDAVLFPALVESEVVLTNSRGVFDRAMAEYVLGLVIGFAKRFPESFALQSQRTWQHRLTEMVEGRDALVVGVGGIGRAIAQLLRGVGMRVTGVGRSARAGDRDFGTVFDPSDLNRLLPRADYVVIAAPLTDETRRMFGTAQLRAMKPTAYLINIARGAIVDEAALVAALEAGEIAGAALDCFETEPLPPESPLWSLPGVVVSPHLSGDFTGHADALVDLFCENFRRFRSGTPLLNIVDKMRGYVPG